MEFMILGGRLILLTNNAIEKYVGFWDVPVLINGRVAQVMNGL